MVSASNQSQVSVWQHSSRLTERQATAILEMRLQKLIGRGSGSTLKDHEATVAKITKYEDILNHYDSMSEVIMEDLTQIKKSNGHKRKTAIENAEAIVLEEPKVEEMDVVFLMDRFGYAKTIDTSAYERNKEAVHNENKYVFQCKNTDKICVFTDLGMMHSIKVMDIPYGRFRDKGTPIDNLGNYSSQKEQMIYVDALENIKNNKLLFVSAAGMVKLVDGSEFDVVKRTIAANEAFIRGGPSDSCRGLPGAGVCGSADEKRCLPALPYE